LSVTNPGLGNGTATAKCPRGFVAIAGGFDGGFRLTDLGER
jgi:hypothetical protein